MNFLQRVEWYLYKKIKRLRLKNRRPSIVASNCVATFIYYDMALPFLSPTINLSFDMNEYVRFLERLPWYLEQPLVPYQDERFDFPCGMLGDVELRFNHYKTFEEARECWERRKVRIDWNNLFLMGIDGDDCTYESLRRFDALPYPNKVILTHKPYPEFSSARYITGFEDRNGVYRITDFKEGKRIRRHMDCFDYISFLNGN